MEEVTARLFVIKVQPFEIKATNGEQVEFFIVFKVSKYFI